MFCTEIAMEMEEPLQVITEILDLRPKIITLLQKLYSLRLDSTHF